MELKKELISKVQRDRGRGNLMLNAYPKPRISGISQWSFPAKPGNKEYEVVQEWLRDGNIILDPPPKNIDINRGDLAYREHPECHLPENESSAVWRYINFPKFISLLVNRALFFSRASNIKDDLYEGVFPKSSITGFGELIRHIKEMHETSPEKFAPNTLNYLEIGQQFFRRLQKEEALINCWILVNSTSKCTT